jgi:glycosyltransferase involved in cell wall biosynthesis
MKKEAMKYTDKEITIIPFGIDTDRFYPKNFNEVKNRNEIVIGTIKTLEKRYGIEYLIKGFSLVKEKFPQLSLKLLIVGGGTQLKYLQNLVKDLHIENVTRFTGYINHDDIQTYHDMLDIYVAVSLQESFGVAVLEASACGKPVVVSNVGGLPEVVDDSESGFIVEAKNPEELADAFSKLICDYELRIEMGKKGRNKVLKEYDWKESIKKMISVYNNLIN